MRCTDRPSFGTQSMIDAVAGGGRRTWTKRKCPCTSERLRKSEMHGVTLCAWTCLVASQKDASRHIPACDSAPPSDLNLNAAQWCPGRIYDLKSVRKLLFQNGKGWAARSGFDHFCDARETPEPTRSRGSATSFARVGVDQAARWDSDKADPGCNIS